MSDQVDQMLESHKFSPDGSIWVPETLQQVRERLEYIDAHECDCDELPHSNALHDLANDDVPVLLKVIEQQAAEVERLRRQKSILAEQLQNIARAISLPIGKDHDKAVMELVAERNQLNAEVERLRVALNAECQAADNAERQVRDYERGVR